MFVLGLGLYFFYFLSVVVGLVVSTGTVNGLERPISNMTCDVSIWTLLLQIISCSLV